MSEQNIFEYKCPACGGTVSFDSHTQMMKCPYCESEFDVEALKKHDADLDREPTEEMKWDADFGAEWHESESGDMLVFNCTSCGGEIVGEKTTAATFCPYCGSNVIVKGALSGGLKPDTVIPFKLDREAAKEAYRAHLKGKTLLPKLFKSEATVEKVTGVYVPFWLYDCTADADVRFKATRTTSWSDSRNNYVKTDTYAVRRAGSVSFCGVPEDGSVKMDDAMMEAIEPFDYSQAVDFQTAYLSGYFADKYDVSADECAPRASERIKSSTVSLLQSTVSGYASCTVETVNIANREQRVRYALLPVWTLNVKYKDKDYRFAMNGQTGKLIGDLPVSRGKFWGIFAAVAAGVTAVGSLIVTFVMK